MSNNKKPLKIIIKNNRKNKMLLPGRNKNKFIKVKIYNNSNNSNNKILIIKLI